MWSSNHQTRRPSSHHNTLIIALTLWNTYTELISKFTLLPFVLPEMECLQHLFHFFIEKKKSKEGIHQTSLACSSSLSYFCTLPAGKNDVLLKSPQEKTSISIIKPRLTHTCSVSLWRWRSPMSGKHCDSANCFYAARNRLGPTGDRLWADNVSLDPAPWNIPLCFHPH